MNSPETIADYAIYYGTKLAPNPHEIDGSARELRNREKYDEIMDRLTIDCKQLPDVILDQSHEIVEAMWAILTDSEGDKIGRLNDIKDYHASQYAELEVRKL